MNPSTITLSSVRIVTEDVPRLSGFYSQITGIQATGDPNTYVEIAFPGGATLAICSQAAIDQFNGSVTSPAQNRSMLLEFAVDDVDAQRRRLEPLVIDWAQQPTDQPWGNRAMLFRDPDGNIVNFFTVTQPTSPLRPQQAAG